jgi:arabinogalactan oligomer / maltooligosaccharide transport system substrate-binding protein
MRKPLPLLLTVALVGALLLSGCVVPSEPTPTPRPGTTPVLKVVPTLDRAAATATKPSQTGLQGVVSLWHSFEGVDAQALEDIMAAFTKEYPRVGFKVTYVPADEIFARLDKEIEPTGGGPDLIIAEGKYAPAWYRLELVQDVEPLPLDESFWETIDPLALSFVEHKGMILGLPLTLHGVVLIRNTSIVPDAPASWDDLVAAAQAATTDDVAGARLDRGLALSGGHLAGLGGSLMDDEDLPLFSDENGLAWMDLLAAYEDADPNATLNDQAEAIEAFAAGKVGFLIGDSELIPQLQDAIGAENLAVDPWPTYGDGGLLGFVETNAVYMNWHATYFRRTISWEFMSYLVGERAQTLFATNRHIPTRVGIETEDPLLQEAAAIVADGAPLPVSPEISLYVEELNGAIAGVFEEGQDPQAALDDAAAAIRSEITGLP